MKIYFNSDFIITKREYEEYYQGSDYHNKLIVGFPKLEYENYTYIYPVFSVKRADGREFGEFALTEYNVENDYIVWGADLPAKALEVEGTLEITILFRYSTDGKYAKVSTGKVLLNVKEAVVSESNIIYVGEETNFLSEIDAIRNEFGVRFDNVETHFISDLAELDNYKTPGIYRFNYNNSNVFDLYITKTYQIRSSSNGYYRRSYNNNDGFGEWIFNEYNVNGSTQWNSEIQYSKGDIVRNNAVYVCITDNKGFAPEEDDENNPLYWIKFEPENYILEDNLKTINGESIIGSGNIEVKGGNVDLSDYLKNGDNKPDDYFNATYQNYNLYAKDNKSMINMSEYSINIGNYTNGSSSIYLGGGNINIYAENDVSLNSKSFNKLYEDVQLLKGNYDLIYPSSDIGYNVSVSSSKEKYAMISKIGGMSYKVNGKIQHTKITDVKLNNNIVIDLSSIQDMEGYGLGINEDCYNYLDFDKDVLVRRVGSYTFAGNETINQNSTNTSGVYRYSTNVLRGKIKPVSINSEIGNILMNELNATNTDNLFKCIEGIAINLTGDVQFYKENIQSVDNMKAFLKGKTIYYELLEPIENALPQIDTFIDVSSGGRFTFENENQQAVPYEIKYIKVV